MENILKNIDVESALSKITAYAKEVMSDLEKYQGSIVPHLLDTDNNSGQRLRDAIQNAEITLGYIQAEKRKSVNDVTNIHGGIDDQIEFLRKKREKHYKQAGDGEMPSIGYRMYQSIENNLLKLKRSEPAAINAYNLKVEGDNHGMNWHTSNEEGVYIGSLQGFIKHKKFINYDSSLIDIKADLIQNYVIMNEFVNSNACEEVQMAANAMIECLTKGGKIMSCGNGGSFSDAQHFASELVGKYRKMRSPIRAFALSDPGVITCIGNDLDYSCIFERQVEAHGNAGDVLLCLSTSGESKNVICAMRQAKHMGIKVISITGNSDNQLLREADISIVIPHKGTADRIQEITIVIIHILVKLIEKGLGYTL